MEITSKCSGRAEPIRSEIQFDLQHRDMQNLSETFDPRSMVQLTNCRRRRVN